MKWKKINEKPDAYAIIFDVGDDVVAVINAFVRERNFSASSFKAIGALSAAQLGWYNPDTRTYETAVDLNEQIELVSLTGDVGKLDGDPVVHMHAVIGRRDGSTRGGHLLKAIVHPTVELFLVEYPVGLVKVHNAEFNLNLFQL